MNSLLFEFLSSSLLQNILAVIAIVVAVVLANRERKYKSLSYWIRNISPFVDEYVWEEIEIYHNGVKVLDPYLSEIVIMNSGTLPLTVSEFDMPIKITMPEPAIVIAANVETDNEQGPMTSKSVDDPSCVIIKNTLMNPGDQFVVRILTDFADHSVIENGRSILPESYKMEILREHLLVSAKVVGISSVQRLKMPPYSWRKLKYVSLTVMSLVTVLLIYVLPNALVPLWLKTVIVIFSFITLLFVISRISFSAFFYGSPVE